jgi:SAM-dependent methyltransferase
MKTRDANWFDQEYQKLEESGLSWGSDEMYAKKIECLRWCCNMCSISNDVNILDVGCGNGKFATVAYKNGFTKVDGIDISKVAIKQAMARNAGHFIVADFTESIDLRVKYSCIFDTDCFHMVVNMDRRRMFLNNVAKNLGNDGVFLTGINSTRQNENPQIVVDDCHQYYWPTCNDYINELTEMGFFVVCKRILPPRNSKLCDCWVEMAFKYLANKTLNGSA